MSLRDGRRPPDDEGGSLGAYDSRSLAQDTAIEWALEQLQDRLRRHSPPGETMEAREAAFDEWDKSESTHDNRWSYTICKGNERLSVEVHKLTLYDPFRVTVGTLGTLETKPHSI